jgi:hypothetical protein
MNNLKRKSPLLVRHLNVLIDATVEPIELRRVEER